MTTDVSDLRLPFAVRSAVLSLRGDSGDGRTLYGTVVPYGQTVVVDDGEGPYREQFAPGAFARSVEQAGHKVKLFAQHNRQRLPMGRAVEFDDRPEGLDVAFRVSETSEGNDLLTLVRDGVVDSFSVGFTGLAARKAGDVTIRTEAALREVSVVAEPAYPGAKIGGIRCSVQEWEWWEALDGSQRAAIMGSDPAAVGTVDGSLAARHDVGIQHAEARMRLLRLTGAI